MRLARGGEYVLGGREEREDDNTRDKRTTDETRGKIIRRRRETERLRTMTWKKERWAQG